MAVIACQELVVVAAAVTAPTPAVAEGLRPAAPRPTNGAISAGSSHVMAFVSPLAGWEADGHVKKPSRAEFHPRS